MIDWFGYLLFLPVLGMLLRCMCCGEPDDNNVCCRPIGGDNPNLPNVIHITTGAIFHNATSTTTGCCEVLSNRTFELFKVTPQTGECARYENSAENTTTCSCNYVAYCVFRDGSCGSTLDPYYTIKFHLYTGGTCWLIWGKDFADADGPGVDCWNDHTLTPCDNPIPPFGRPCTNYHFTGGGGTMTCAYEAIS